MVKLIPLLIALPLMSQTPDLAQLERMTARFAPTPLHVDTSKLSPGDQKALAKLIEAAHLVDHLFLTQYWSGNLAFYTKLQKDSSPLGRARLKYFWMNKGPWSALDDLEAFLPDVPARKLPGANFYPSDMTKDEFETWAFQLPKAEKEQAQGFFSVIRRLNGKLVSIPYSVEYAPDLNQLSKLLDEAAALTDNATLKRFLTLRAKAFHTDDYYESDVAWMDLDAPLVLNCIS